MQYPTGGSTKLSTELSLRISLIDFIRFKIAFEREKIEKIQTNILRYTVIVLVLCSVMGNEFKK